MNNLLSVIAEHMWQPLKLADRVDSTAIATSICIASLIVFGQFVYLTYYWFYQRVPLSRTHPIVKVAAWLTATCFCCAMSGYGATLLSAFAPKYAVCVRLVTLGATIVSAWRLIHYSHCVNLDSLTTNESVGEAVSRINLECLSDRDFHKVVTKIRNESLTRLEQKHNVPVRADIT